MIWFEFPGSMRCAIPCARISHVCYELAKINTIKPTRPRICVCAQMYTRINSTAGAGHLSMRYPYCALMNYAGAQDAAQQPAPRARRSRTSTQIGRITQTHHLIPTMYHLHAQKQSCSSRLAAGRRQCRYTRVCALRGGCRCRYPEPIPGARVLTVNMDFKTTRLFSYGQISCAK